MAILPPLPQPLVVRCHHEASRHTCVRCAMETARHRATGRVTSLLRPTAAIAVADDAFGTALNLAAKEYGDLPKDRMFGPCTKVTTLLGLEIALSAKARAAAEKDRIGRMVKQVVSGPIGPCERVYGTHGSATPLVSPVPSVYPGDRLLRIRLFRSNDGPLYATSVDGTTTVYRYAVSFGTLDAARAFLSSLCNWIGRNDVAIVDDHGREVETAGQVRVWQAETRLRTDAAVRASKAACGPFAVRRTRHDGQPSLYATCGIATDDPRQAEAFHTLAGARLFLVDIAKGWLDPDVIADVAIVNDFGDVVETAAVVRTWAEMEGSPAARPAAQSAPRSGKPTNHPCGWPAPPTHPIDPTKKVRPVF